MKFLEEASLAERIRDNPAYSARARQLGMAVSTLSEVLSGTTPVFCIATPMNQSVCERKIKFLRDSEKSLSSVNNCNPCRTQIAAICKSIVVGVIPCFRSARYIFAASTAS